MTIDVHDLSASLASPGGPRLRLRSLSHVLVWVQRFEAPAAISFNP
ncbi:hypothetical protein [Roseimaritima ulvae]|nr:hypothetical protein [Roseimaritima ulvae]